MPLLKAKYLALTGEDLEEDTSNNHGWELVFANEEAFSAHSTLTSDATATLTETDALSPCPKCNKINCGVTHTSGTDGVTSTGSLTEHFMMVDVMALPTKDMVYVSKLGQRFHFSNDCKGLQRVTTQVTLVEISKALRDGKTLCHYCEDTTTCRAEQRNTFGCGFTNTFMNFYCCQRCRDGKATSTRHGRRCALNASSTSSTATASGLQNN